MNIADYYHSRIITNIQEQENDNLIFVIQGIGEECLNKFDDIYITDKATFLSNHQSAFNKTWFTQFFTALNLSKDFHLISYAQLTFLFSYIDPSFFIDRIVILQDNLRQLYPLNAELYFEKSEDENIEKRSENIPLHHAEQFKIGGNFYYSLKSISQKLKTIALHQEEKDLEIKDVNGENEVIDMSDLNELDTFLNKFMDSPSAFPSAFVKLHKKQPMTDQTKTVLKQVNGFLNKFGSSLYYLPEVSIDQEYIPKKETLESLKEYWGLDATFRNLKVYNNPNSSKEIIDISQGLIVDTIIQEYENSKNLKEVRDLFLTAPTGAGKSLLFQLPSFYVSKKGDVTIVVSPLIALMKDQVKAIRSERNYHKVAYLNSELSLIDRDQIIESCKNGEIDILYMSPELLLSYDISHFIGERKLGLMVIDEAHLITTWGRDFRVDYWFLGNHIRKIRKYKNIKFPLVAVTATAIYGGSNDMVFDSIDSLVMQNPHIFIGQVKRNDIEFVINNHDKFERRYEKNKLNQTVDFIRGIDKAGLRTLVYAPYTKHIRQILTELKDQPDIVTGYYGSLDANSKELAYRQFKKGDKNTMVSTKAFGMGVDIPDIQVVYHHAPSGLLPDYVQEIGRVARKPEIKGFAALNYSSQDQRFSKALHGMSALRQYQLKEVLKKIHKAYLKNDSRNLLLSIDDFGHIFENANDLDQKVLTALMMIEKDYLAKNRFNVLIARPKKLFVDVFASVSNIDYDTLKEHYPTAIKKITSLHQNVIIEVNLDKIWIQHFKDKSFPSLKYVFYKGNLFNKIGVSIKPQLKISFERIVEFNQAYQELENLFTSLQTAFVGLQGHYFSEEDLLNKINYNVKDKMKAEKLAKFVLSTFSGRVIQQGVIEEGAFLQRKRDKGSFTYRVFNNRYLQEFASMLKRFSRLYQDTDVNIVNRYITNKETNAIKYVRLGYFMEMLEIGTFEIKGGENPMVFIRINDPQRIERDANNNFYENTLLNKTLERHYLSNEIFDHFFLNGFSNEERWSFIEDFFLGEDIDTLLSNYQSNEPNDLDILDYLRKEKQDISLKQNSKDEGDSNIHIFKAKPDGFYKMENLLTIEVDGKNETMKVSQWLNHNPVAFDLDRRKNKLKIDKKVFNILVNRLKLHHHDYFKKSLGLDLRIDMKGYERPVKAIVPYRNKPIEFYKWWCKNKDEVYLSFKEKIELIDKVKILNPSLLSVNHKKMINN